MSALSVRFGLIEEALAEAEAAPLAARKARLLAALIDDFCDRAWKALKADPAQVFNAEDVLAFRSALATASPEMATVMALADARPAGPRLEIRAVAVPIEDYPGLSVQDFMVSLYNGLSVMRVVIVAPDGTICEALPLMRAAVAYWASRLAI